MRLQILEIGRDQSYQMRAGRMAQQKDALGVATDAGNVLMNSEITRRYVFDMSWMNYVGCQAIVEVDHRHPMVCPGLAQTLAAEIVFITVSPATALGITAGAIAAGFALREFGLNSA